MRDQSTLLRETVLHERLREIHDSWTPAVRHRRAEEGRQRREEFLQLILKETSDDRSTNIMRKATPSQSAAARFEVAQQL